MDIIGKRAELNLLEDYCDLTDEEKQEILSVVENCKNMEKLNRYQTLQKDAKILNVMGAIIASPDAMKAMVVILNPSRVTLKL